MSGKTERAETAVLLFDGAMGTYYASMPGRAEARCELANLERPQEVLAVHRAYLEAGCRAIRTNTFDVGGELCADPETARRIVEAGCRIALEAAAPYDAVVFADLGPAPRDEARTPEEIYGLEASWFLEAGVSHFVLETLPTDDGVAAFARTLKARRPDAYLLVSFAVGADGMTREGMSGKAMYARVGALPEVDAVGFNCMSGPFHLLQYIRTLPPTAKPLSVMPNAGYPTVLGRRVVYHGKPAYFAEQLAEMAGAGAGILGGCCGTTPDHIAAAAAALAGVPVGKPAVRIRPRSGTAAAAEPGSNAFRDKLETGRRVIAVELDPPADDRVSDFLDGVRTLRDAGADAVTISDCPIGRPRADSSLLACRIRRELGVEPLPHMTCRDRNLNATKALLLGLAMEGVHNVLLVTGDPIPSEDRDEVKSVFNFNSRKLIRYVHALGETVLSVPFQIFGALNVNARNFDVQLRLAQEKEAAGAAGFLTQPVHSQMAADNLQRARETLRGKLLGGIFPIVSYRNACFLNNEVTGVYVPDEVAELYRDKDREAAEDLAVTLALETAARIAPYTDGLYLMTPFRRVGLMTRILDGLRRENL